MSADNGVYVLHTEGPNGPEYRVAYAQAIDNIYGTFNEKTFSYEGNLDTIKALFSESDVFRSLDEALDKAEDLHYDVGYTEYGIVLINEFRHLGHIFP